MKLGIVSGTSINRSKLLAAWEPARVETAFGPVAMRRSGECFALNRHGFENPLPPHAINYRANVAALLDLGVEQVVTLNSVGSLDPLLPPGSLVSCADYMSFSPKTFLDDRQGAFAPVVGNELLEEIAAVSPIPILRGKVYAQTPGPRFETRAEVRALRRAWGADVVGMTFANEADLMLERGLKITAFAIVDNYAHGVAGAPLSLELFEALVASNQRKVDAFLEAIAERFGGA